MFKDVKKALKDSMPTIVGVSVVLLAIRFAGHLPVISDLAKAIKGDTAAKFNWFGLLGGAQ